MKVKTLALTALYNGEALQFFKSGMARVTADTTVATAVAAPLAALQTPVARIEELFVTDQASGVTPEMEAFDRTRDSLLTGMSFIIQGYTYHPNPTTRAAAEKLMHSIDVYGDTASGINKQSYQLQTATITNLINDWSASGSELYAAVTTLSLGVWLSDLSTANIGFDTKYTQRGTQRAATATEDTIREQRGLANTAWRALTTVLEAMSLMATPPTPYETIISQLNDQIEDYRTLLAGRNTNTTQPGDPGTPDGGGTDE